MVQKIGRGGNERGGEGKEEKEEERKRKRRRRKRTKRSREGGGSLSKISSEEILSKLRLKLNQNKAHPQNTPAGRRIHSTLYFLQCVYVSV